jgi:putative redox protein
MTKLSVTHLAGDRFELRVRGHRLVTDQPVADGGAGQGPTPTELFVASLTACVAFYAARFLARHDLDPGGLRVDGDFTMSADRPPRVASIVLRLVTPHPLPDNRRRALLAVADHCTVHNSIRQPPDVRIALVEPAGAGSAAAPAAMGG